MRDPTGIELIAVEFDCGRQRIILASVYRTGNIQKDKDLFLEYLTNWMAEIGPSCNRLVLTGDMNFDALTKSDYPFDNTCEVFKLKQWINTVTHKERAIDLLFTGSLVTLQKFGLSSPIENYHKEVFAHIEMTGKKTTITSWARL